MSIFPIRVLQIFGGLDCGGAETMLMNIYRNIDRSKIQFDFIKHTNKDCFYDEEIKAMGGKIYSLPKFKGSNIISYSKCFKELLKKHPEWQVIHSHIRSTASILLSIAKREERYTIIHSHSTSEKSGLVGSIKTLLEKPLRYIADFYFACSHNAGLWLFGKRIVKGDKFRLLTNAIDLSNFQFNPSIREKIRKELGIQDKIVLGHIGRFAHPKNHKFLIEVFEALSKNNKNLVLVLIGDGEQKDDIKNKVNKNKQIKNNVLFLGVRNDINEIMSAFDLFLLPSIYEGLGIVLIEAQINGLCCIASDRVPEEVKITQNIDLISLKHTTWIDAVQNFINNYNGRVNERIYSAAYDIKENIKFLEKFYLERYYAE